MTYTIQTTEQYNDWLDSLDAGTVVRVHARLDRIKLGNFGDFKNLGESLYELRFFFGAGYRIYYTFRGDELILLLVGGDKSTQKRDIKLARQLLDELE